MLALGSRRIRCSGGLRAKEGTDSMFMRRGKTSGLGFGAALENNRTLLGPVMLEPRPYGTGNAMTVHSQLRS